MKRNCLFTQNKGMTFSAWLIQKVPLSVKLGKEGAVHFEITPLSPNDHFFKIENRVVAIRNHILFHLLSMAPHRTVTG